jgi:hypothetical protein
MEDRSKRFTPGVERDATSGSGREPEEDENFHPLAVFLGILIVLLLVLGAWVIFEQARCNPLYSDSGLFRSQSCR